MLNHFSCVQLFATLWTVACQAPLSMGFSRQEYWSELPCPPPGYLPNPGIEPGSLTSPALAGGFFTTSAIWVVTKKYPNCSLTKKKDTWRSYNHNRKFYYSSQKILFVHTLFIYKSLLSLLFSRWGNVKTRKVKYFAQSHVGNKGQIQPKI